MKCLYLSIYSTTCAEHWSYVGNNNKEDDIINNAKKIIYYVLALGTFVDTKVTFSTRQTSFLPFWKLIAHRYVIDILQCLVHLNNYSYGKCVEQFYGAVRAYVIG